MKSAEFMKIVLKPNKAAQPPAGRPALDVDYRATEEFISRAVIRYDKTRTEYLQIAGDDPRLTMLTKRWERASYALATWATAWFAIHLDNKDEQQNALDILDRITKDAAMREINLWEQRERVEAQEPSDQRDAELERLDEAEERADRFLLTSLLTQDRFNRLHAKDPETMDVELKSETVASAQFDRIRHLVPPHKLWRIASIFPMHRVPKGQRVPQPPDAFQRILYEDPENLVFDPTLDELVIKPGYVSEDGLIDDKTAIWHPENNTVDIGYRGGERTVWQYWKPKDIRDMPARDSWLTEYLRRAYDQWLEDSTPGLLKPKPEDEDYPYNRIPPKKE